MVCNCPDAVIAVLDKAVRVELDKLQGILSLSSAFDRALSGVAGVAIDQVRTAVDLIPTLTGLNFADILQYLTCPLTPLALLIDFDAFKHLDPRIQIANLKAMFEHTIAEARKAYEEALSGSAQREIINIAKRFANEFARVRLDPVGLAKAVAISAAVFTLCPEVYETRSFKRLADIAENFSLTSGLPTGLDDEVAELIGVLQLGEAKIEALKAFIAL